MLFKVAALQVLNYTDRDVDVARNDCIDVFSVWHPTNLRLALFVAITGWESSTTETPWNSVTTTMLGSVRRGVSECHFLTLRPAWLRATAIFGWKRDTGVLVRHKNM